MDKATSELMDRVVKPILDKESSELSRKLRQKAAHVHQQGTAGSPFGWSQHVMAHHDHYKDLAKSVLEAMLRVIEDADAPVEPGHAAELKQRYDGYLIQHIGRIRSSNEKILPLLEAPEPIPTFETVVAETKNHHHNEIDLWVRKAIADRKKGNVNVTYNLTGNNPKVNINSQDYSLTVQNAHPIFDSLRQAIQQGVEDPTKREELVKKATELEQSVGDKPKYLQKYNEFITAAEKTISVIGHLLPAISQYLLQ